ncbi:MAG: peptidoglycan-associated lipoprotein Pal [Pseudomonadota bacterium]|nr:peptidoglycan-associated lipoprotein Pal [Pseudomonadota bacterium]
MKRILSLALIVALSSLLAACPKKPTTVPNANAGQVVAPVSGASTGSASADANQVRPLANDSASSAGSEGVLASTIRFEYDSSEIKAEYAPVISAQGKRLAADRRAAVRLEGHTDERGSAEYNVALGERRAQAVKKALLLQGASESQLSTVSYGEERPVTDGHDEAAWAQNRRVEIIVLAAH